MVSDFTLHEFFAPPGNTGATYEGDIMHTDYITIPDAPLPDLLHAFRLDYELTPRPKPLDVVLVAGYVDMMRGFDKEYIVRGYRKFSETVLSLPNKDPEAKNCFTIASLMYPPSQCWLPDNGPTPFRYDNKLEKFDWLNQEIKAINDENGSVPYPGFHSYGIRTDTHRSSDKNGIEQITRTRSHRWEHWAEPARRDKFTLRTDRRFKMGKAINNFFISRS